GHREARTRRGLLPAAVLPLSERGVFPLPSPGRGGALRKDGRNRQRLDGDRGEAQGDLGVGGRGGVPPGARPPSPAGRPGGGGLEGGGLPRPPSTGTFLPPRG